MFDSPPARLTVLFTLSLCVLGCWGGEEPAVEARKPDDAKAVEALEKAGARLARDGEGSVIAVDLADTRVGNDVVAHAAKLPHLRDLNLKDATITDEGLEPLLGLTNLRVLDLWNTKITGHALRTIAKIDTLTNLRLRKCDGPGLATGETAKPEAEMTDAEKEEAVLRGGVTNTSIAYLADMPNLKELDIRFTKVGDPGMKHIAKIASLEDLKLQGNEVTEAGLAEIKDLEHVKRLDLWGDKYGDETFDHIQGFDLVQLEIDEIRLLKPAESLRKLAGFPNLEILGVHNLAVTDEVCEIIGGFSKMKSLNLRNTFTGDAGLEHIGKLSNLEKLVLSECSGVTDEGLKHLSGLNKLKTLDLWATKWEGPGLVHLTDLPELRELIIKAPYSDFGMIPGGPDLDAAVAELAKLPKLEQLVLDELPITADAIEPFKQVKTLKKLSIKNCLEFDAASVDQLRLSMPKVEVLY